jgi:MFS family permease
MTAGCGLARHYWTLFLGRVGVGIGEATLSPCAYTLLTDWVFRDPAALNRSLAVICGASSLVGWWLIRRSRRAFLAAGSQPA